VGRIRHHETALHPVKSQSGPFYQLIQRLGERPEDWQFKSVSRDNRLAMRPKRYPAPIPNSGISKSSSNADQALGWKRAGTHNLHIRYGQMTMALIAQTVVHPAFAPALGEPIAVGIRVTWPNHSSRDSMATFG